MVGNGVNTLFWEDLWTGDVCLKKKFLRLYKLSSLKHHAIADCGFLDGLVWVWNF